MKESPGPIVVEGRIAEGRMPYRIDPPRQPGGPENFPQVTDAKVTLLDNRGNEGGIASPGLWSLPVFQDSGATGVQYSLHLKPVAK